MSTDTFTAWAGTEKSKPLSQIKLQLKQWDEDSVEMNITHCGICGSDIQALDESWGPTDFPCVVGHEIVGVITRVGNNVTNLKVGDRAGAGAQSDSCHNWEASNGDKAYGGYADKWRGDSRFVFKIPDAMSSADATVFLCGGIASYDPFKRANLSSKSVVGIMGLGGLGHFGVLFAKAMGATVIGISSESAKHDVALELGCDDYINSSDNASMAKFNNKLTHILLTGTGSDFEWQKYFNLLKFNGHFLNLVVPEWELPKINVLGVIFKHIKIEFSAIGSPAEIKDMLNFAAEKNIKPWIDVYPMSEVNRAIEDFRAGKPRFRFVLKN